MYIQRDYAPVGRQPGMVPDGVALGVRKKNMVGPGSDQFCRYGLPRRDGRRPDRGNARDTVVHAARRLAVGVASWICADGM